MIKIDEEFRSLIPPMTADEYAGLEKSIKAEGCRDSLVTWNDTLIDGHNRYEICSLHGIPFNTVAMNFDNRDAAMTWIIKNQFSRRNILTATRCMLAGRLEEIVARQNKEKQIQAGGDRKSEGYKKSVSQPVGYAISNETEYKKKSNKEIHENQTADIVAKSAGISRETYRQFKQVQEKAPEPVKQAVMSGETSIKEAYKQVKKVEKEEHAKAKAERKKYELQDEMPPDVCRLICSDIKSGLSEIDDGSIDFIITDPPYPKEYIPLYANLSTVAERVLKPGGSMLVMCGQSYLPEVMQMLASGGMSYHWTLAYMTPGGQSPQLWHKRTNTFWKPVLWYVKGEYSGDYVGDVLKSPVNDNDKRFHEWGQSLGGMRDIVERFTDPGHIILDPFLGGGTTGVAAVSMGRKFIGVDIEKENVNISEERIKEAYCEGSQI